MWTTKEQVKICGSWQHFFYFDNDKQSITWRNQAIR